MISENTFVNKMCGLYFCIVEATGLPPHFLPINIAFQKYISCLEYCELNVNNTETFDFRSNIFCILVVGLHEKIKNRIHFPRYLEKYFMVAVN
jgi:hypothetical protein